MDCRVKPGNDNKEDSFVSTIKVLSAGAVQSMVEALGREFERASGNKLDLIFNTAGALRDRVKNGESADLVILSESIIASLDKSGMFVPGSIINLGRTVTGVAVREGAPVTDISTPEAFKQALLKAKTVAYTDPKAGGSGGIMFAAMLERLGIADEVNKKGALDRGRAGGDRHHLHQRSSAGAGRQSHRPTAGRAAHRQHLYGGHPGRQCIACRGDGLAARTHRSRHSRALDRGRPGAGVLGAACPGRSAS